MCAKPFLGKLPPYRLLVESSGSAQEGISMVLRLETRANLHLAYSLRATVDVRQTTEVPELVIHVRALQLLEAGTYGNAPAALEYRYCLPRGVDRVRCTVVLGNQQQSFLLGVVPSGIRLLGQKGVGAPLAELVLR